MSKANRPESGIEDAQQTRRKIIKGLAGLPAMMTLASGSAFANSSSQQCLSLDPADAKYRPTPGDRESCLPPEDVNVIPGSDDQLAIAPNDDALRTLDNGDYCLLYVDENGNITEPSSSETGLVTHSCYTSFMTHAINRIT